MKRVVLSLAVAALAGSLFAGEATYIVQGANPVSRVINGYVQEVAAAGNGRWLVQVSTEAVPIRAEGRVTSEPPREVLAEALRVPEGFRVPPGFERLACQCGDPFERAERILRWLENRIRLDENERSPQDAASVLERRSARCSGLANAAVALLRRSGLPARPVSGILVTSSGPVPHRWLEVYFDEAGWVATDPTLGMWIVTPRHVTCDRPAVGALSVTIRRLREDDLGVLPRSGGIAYRPLEGARLMVHMKEMPGRELAKQGRVVLEGPGGSRREAALGREITFGALLPGRWSLLLELRGKVVRSVSFRLRSGDVRSFMLPLPEREASS